MQYLFQGWNARLPGKYEDMLLAIGTEELGHVEMITTMIAMHQMQWLAALQQLEEDGLEKVPVPEAFPLSEELPDWAYRFVNHSDGRQAGEGRWAHGPALDGSGNEFTCAEKPPPPSRDKPLPPPAGDPRLFGTPPATHPQGMLGKVKEKLT